MTDEEKINAVWNQSMVPVAFRAHDKSVSVRIPFHPGNRSWLRNGRTANPEWMTNDKYWKLPKAWFNDFVNRSINHFGKVYIIQPYRECEKCSPSCRKAKGHVCSCSCMGVHHGASDERGFFDVTDAFSIRWGNEYFACRLLTRKA